MQDAWDHYYFGRFSKFDCLLRNYIEDGGQEYTKFFPLSVSHHNLHRLIEVLRLEIGRGSLDSTRVQERIIDLLEVTDRLEKLLKEATRDGTYERSLLYTVKRYRQKTKPRLEYTYAR